MLACFICTAQLAIYGYFRKGGGRMRTSDAGPGQQLLLQDA